MFPAMDGETGVRFAPLQRRQIFGAGRSINITSLRDGEPGPGSVVKKTRSYAFVLQKD